ncbi:hypothetical protein M5K25_004826 [Dendrobium thyrsiflorum]|uniref:Uncharacterized protein n=1 Tax=Dendrobium thyrsiflorum TaxID=117978 RepID=A0ABD0VG11_DENTH
MEEAEGAASDSGSGVGEGTRKERKLTSRLASSSRCFRQNVVTSDPADRKGKSSNERGRTTAGRGRPKKRTQGRKFPSRSASSRRFFRSKCGGSRSDKKESRRRSRVEGTKSSSERE